MTLVLNNPKGWYAIEQKKKQNNLSLSLSLSLFLSDTFFFFHFNILNFSLLSLLHQLVFYTSISFALAI